MKDDTALAQFREVLPFSEFVNRYPLVFASSDPVIALDLHQTSCVDLQPAPWPVAEPQLAIATIALRRPGVIVVLLDGDTAIMGTPRAIFRHLRDEATIRFWLGPEAGTVQQCLEVSRDLVQVSSQLGSVVA